MTSSLCPTCGTPNPPHSLFCEKCGTRLIASLAEEPEEQETPTPSTFVPKGLSLPTKSGAGAEPPAAAPTPIEPQKPAESITPAEEEMPDWMQVVQSAVTGTSELDIAKATAASGASDQAAAEEVPDWLGDLGLADQSAAAKKPDADELLPEWAQRLRTMPEAAQPPAAEEEVPDWLKTLGTTGQLPAGEETPAVPIPAKATETPARMADLGAPAEPAAAEEELPEWLKEPATPYFSTEPSEPPPPPPPVAQVQPAPEEMPDWLRDLRPAAGAEEALPDWLDELGAEEQPTSEPIALSTGDSALDWLSQLSATAPEAPSTQAAEPSDWMSSLRAAAPEVDTQPTEEVPGWLSGLEAEQPPLETPAASEVPDWMSSFRAASIEPEATAEEEGVPDWLKGAGLAATGAAAVSGSEEEQPPEPAASLKPVTDWLAALRQAAPEMESEQAAAEEIPDWMSVVSAEETQPAAQAAEEIPEWLRESTPPLESTAAPPAMPPEEEGVPDWLKGMGLAAAGAAAVSGMEEEQPPEPIASQKPATDWLSALRQAAPEMEAEQAAAEEQPAAQAEEEGVPDWLRGFGAATAGAAGAFAEEQQPEEITPQKPPTDWLSALRQAAPEMEAEQAAAEEVPEWMREETGVSPEAIGGPQAYEQEVPEWLRETGVVAAPASPQIKEEGVPDWLREETDATLETTQAPTAAQAEEEAGVPDWLRGLGGAAAVGAAAAAAPRAEEPAEEGLPDWLREAEPAPALTFEEPQAEEAVPGEMPDWLRELTPTAAATGAAMAAAEPEVEEPEEIEPPEEAAEAEPEAEGGILAAATIAAGVAGAAKRLEKEEAAPAEMPEWLKEIRQEQQVAKKAIPVPPSEVTGLTQAEIPAWLEALRPTEEVAAPQEAEAPLEMEGPLAGIANALPPAPIMGELQGPAVKLQFAISAEDQARAGILKELLTQHAVAPAAVEQFVVKGSVIRRRTLRWIVAFLILGAIFLTKGIDINAVAPVPLVPKVQEMVLLPAVREAAFEISKLAQLPPDSKVLVVFDYDATQAGELNRVADALLRSPALGNTQIEVASLNPQGSAVAQMVLKDLPGLKYTDLGFVPGQVNGVQSLLAQAGDVKLIIDLAASPETVRWWAEQMKANHAEIPLVVGVSAGAEPLTMPYLQSGQVKGLVSGFPGAVTYLNATGVMATLDPTDQLNNYQAPLDGLALANYVMVALIVAGLIGALLRGSRRRSA